MFVELHYDSIADLCRTRVAPPACQTLNFSHFLSVGKSSATPPLCCESTQNERWELLYHVPVYSTLSGAGTVLIQYYIHSCQHK